MFSTMLVAVLLGVQHGHEVLTDRVDVVELNTMCNTNDGLVVFDQIIWWNWNVKECRYEVVDWRTLKGVRAQLDESVIAAWRADVASELPVNRLPPCGAWIGGGASPERQRDGTYVSDWHDEKSNMHRRVIATIFKRSYTLHDPELVNREFLPQDKRLRLKSRK